MGREIRKVIPNWEHPKESKYNPYKRIQEEDYTPLYNEPVEDAWQEWTKKFQAWKDGKRALKIKEYDLTDYDGLGDYESFCSWDGRPPNPEYYRPAWKESDMTWFQVYETVSEGTPVTPPFETADQLIDYLVENGDFWDQKRRKEGNSVMDCQPWSRQSAERFVRNEGWAPSMVVSDGKIMSGVEFVTRDKQETQNQEGK